MKHISKILIFFLFSAIIFTSCDGLLDVNSDRIVTQDEYQMNSANDTLYSMFGIMSKVQKLADSYVLLGELRGDLMDVSESSNLNLKEISNFEISANNKYANNIKDYYAVINNCNYVIHNIDTSVVRGGKKVMYREYTAAKAIRAWTYMQIALNFQKAKYYEQPILSLEDAQQTYPEYTLEELAPRLIEDLLPWRDVEWSYFEGYCFPVRFVLGDLYLWTGQYENAANEYRDLIFKKRFLVYSSLSNTREVTNNAFTGIYKSRGWDNIFENYAELITAITASNQYGHQFDLDSLVWNRKIIPSTVSINNWDSAMYYHSSTLDTLGDLRKIGSVVSNVKLYSSNTVTSYSTIVTPKTENYIYKYILMNPASKDNKSSKQIMVYREALLYLRYAEAVNRLGKPNLAMAVLKNGLNRVTLANRKIIPASEIGNALPNYMNFTDNRFDNNVGIRMRGCGNVNNDTTYYVIPKLANLTDSVQKVEDLIVKELALETAFEGNRFHDLMRVAIRRNDNSYLANLVAAKHLSNKEAIKTKLMDRANWYLKK